MLYLEIRLFNKEPPHSPYGANQYQRLAELGSWVSVIEKAREYVREEVLRDKLFEAKLEYHGDLWKLSDGVGTQCITVPIWSADPINSQNPILGFKEELLFKLPESDMKTLGFEWNVKEGSASRQFQITGSGK